ncbi:MAG: hypothetical protein U0791_11680 [Gemmataceae bacterium]
MADKLTQQIVEALTKAAAEPAGLPLFVMKNAPGLFPTSAKAAAQKCLADRLLASAANDRHTLTEAGWQFLLTAVNPKQVLEDFVRVLELRQGEVNELLDTARSMAGSLQGLKDAVTRVLPKVTAARIETREPLTDVLLALLRSHSAAAGEDCSLSDLYRRLQPRPTIGEFHDALRVLHAANAIYLHPWTGPLTELPDPACALLAGHGVAYYASPRTAAFAKPRAALQEAHA